MSMTAFSNRGVHLRSAVTESVDFLGGLVKSPASSGIPQEGVDFPGVQFLGSTSRQKPSYRHPRARVPMLSMVEYSCTVQLFRTAVLCHVINRSVTSSDTSS